MSKRQTNKLRDSDIVGLKYFDRLMPLLERLHGVGAQRDRAGNRQLFFDHYCAYLLLFLFNPIVTSLRGIQQASELKKVQKKLGCPRASLGSLSEAVEVFDPEPVKQIASELAAQLEPLGNNRSFPEVKHLVTAVDGTVVKTLARIVQAAYLRSPTDEAGRLPPGGCHTHFDASNARPAGTHRRHRARAQGAKTTSGRFCIKTLQADQLLRHGPRLRPILRCSTPSRRSAAAMSATSVVRDNSVYASRGTTAVVGRSGRGPASPSTPWCVWAVGSGKRRVSPDHLLRLIFIFLSRRTTNAARRGRRLGRPRSDGVPGAHRHEPARRTGRGDRLYLPGSGGQSRSSSAS